MAIPGLGPAKAASVIAALELARTVSQAQNPPLFSATDVYGHMVDLITEPREHAVVFSLDVHAKLIRRDIVSIGTATASLIHPRDVFRQAISANGLSVIVAHNHPSGSPTPSSADIAVTKQLVKAGLVVGIPLRDHVVCGRDGFTSLAASFPEIFA